MAFRSKAHISDVHLVPIPPYTYQEILRLDVTIDDVFLVNIFETTKKLVGKH